MGDFVTLICPNCGGKLQITPDIDRFACTHCGNEHVVKRSEGMIAIQPLANSLTGLQRATDRTAAELGLRRTNEELARIEARHSTASRALAEAQLALEQGRRRKNGLIVAIALGAPAVLLCMVGTAAVPMVAYSAGEQTVSDTLSGVSASHRILHCCLVSWRPCSRSARSVRHGQRCPPARPRRRLPSLSLR